MAENEVDGGGSSSIAELYWNLLHFSGISREWLQGLCDCELVVILLFQ